MAEEKAYSLHREQPRLPGHQDMPGGELAADQSLPSVVQGDTVRLIPDED